LYERTNYRLILSRNRWISPSRARRQAVSQPSALSSSTASPLPTPSAYGKAIDTFLASREGRQAARFQHPPNLAQRLTDLGEIHDTETAGYPIKALVPERESVSVGLLEGHVRESGELRVLFRECQHATS
jgi:hypothetical protein